jgi:hypothetical protein
MEQEKLAEQEGIAALQWDTRGGGDLHFLLNRLDENSYIVRNIRFDFGITHPDLVISKETEAELFMEIDKIFSGECQVLSHPRSAMLTGTWSSISLTSTQGKTTLYRNPILLECEAKNILVHLNQFVRNQISKFSHTGD